MTGSSRRCLNVLMPLAIILFTLTNARDSWGAESVDCSLINECRKSFIYAQNLAKEKNFEESLRILAPLYRKYPDPHLSYPLARLYHRLKQPKEAIVLYQRYIDSKLAVDAEEEASVRVFLKEAQREAAATSSAVASGSSGPAGAALDGPSRQVGRPAPDASASESSTSQATRSADAGGAFDRRPAAHTAVVESAPNRPVSDGYSGLAKPPEGAAERVPLYKRWWLWTVVGVGVAGIAVGIAVGVAAQQPTWPGAFEYKPIP